MATSRGRDAVRRYMAQLPEQIERSLLPGAARAGAKVIADEAKERARSGEIAEKIGVRVVGGDGHVVAKIRVGPGWARSLAIWQEYGTAPHFITVDDSQREGMTVGRINRLAKVKGTLVINGRPVGTTVHHPGAQAYPFMRPALDVKEADAIRAAQAHIDARVSRRGIAPDTEDTTP